MIHRGSDKDLVLRPDLCIVGSGPGGAMVASRLSRAGARVVVLEEGGYHTKSEFDMQEATAYPRLYQDRGNRATADLSMQVLQGRAVGGGTVVNWTTSYRTPDHVLEHWRRTEGLALTPEVLERHFDEVEQRLGIQKVDYEDTNANNRAIYDGCGKLGWQVDTTRRNVRGCLRTGYCGMGCPVDAKQSAALTYLPDAVDAGAEVYANCRVQKIEWSGKRATAVTGAFLHPDTQEATGRSVRVEPRVVVVAGGALNSPALLLQSGLTQGPVGKKTWLHPVVAVGAFYDQRVEGFYGAPQSVASHHFARREQGAGFFIEAAPVHPMLSSTAMPGFGASLRGDMKLLAHVCATISLMVDGFDPAEDGGTVTLREGGGPKLDYPFTDRMAECFRAGMKAMARIHLANGAREIVSFHAQSVRLRKESELSQLDAAPVGPNRLAVFTAHQMGGCRMGTDPARSVVNPQLRHHAVENLFVVDGSVFPTSLGVNPMESIYGVASWASEHVRAAL
ncbi:MAG TPA: GMC family oxidoreductase [Myxococcales bacterium]|jgi:choline dehydrogenase-like flavoprotein|nr:GMC family oxidoreductase [Myxococcales bacterium]